MLNVSFNSSLFQLLSELEESNNLCLGFLTLVLIKYVSIPQNIGPRNQNGVMQNSGCVYLG